MVCSVYTDVLESEKPGGRADIFILLIARDGSDFLAVFRNPRRVLLVFKDPLFPYCTCVIKDPIKSSDFLRFCPGLWRK